MDRYPKPRLRLNGLAAGFFTLFWKMHSSFLDSDRFVQTLSVFVNILIISCMFGSTYVHTLHTVHAVYTIQFVHTVHSPHTVHTIQYILYILYSMCIPYHLYIL